MAENILLHTHTHAHTHIYIWYTLYSICTMLYNNDLAVAVAATTTDAVTARRNRLRKSRKSSPFGRGVFGWRRWAFLYIFSSSPMEIHIRFLASIYVCVRRAPVGVRVLAIIGRRSRRGKRRRRRRSSKRHRRRRRRIRKNAILIRSERSGRWKFPRSGLCKGKKLRRCVASSASRARVYTFTSRILL